MEISKILTITGLALDILGAFFLIRGLIISKKEALRLGTSRLCGSTDEENLKLPKVQDRIKQSKNAIYGGILLIVGFIFQVIGQLF